MSEAPQHPANLRMSRNDFPGQAHTTKKGAQQQRRPPRPNRKNSRSDLERTGSSWDEDSLLEGLNSRQMSRQGSQVNVDGRKLKGLEKVYLQRLEAHPSGRNRVPASKLQKNKTRTKFRARDRGFEDFEAFEDDRGDEISQLIADNYRKMTQKFKGNKSVAGFA